MKIQTSKKSAPNRNRHIRLIAITFIVLTTFASYAQTPNLVKVKKRGMRHIAFLAGQWEGSGWIFTQQGQRKTFQQSENIQWKLDSTILLIEGHGIDNMGGADDGKLIHDALAIVSFDHKEKNYHFNSYLGTNGLSTEAKGILGEDGSFTWGFDTPQGRINYIIMLKGENEWHENGEFIRPDGAKFQFIEMTLNRIH